MIIKIKNLSCFVDTEFYFNLEKQNHIFLGLNGSGKTQFLELLEKYLKDHELDNIKINSNIISHRFMISNFFEKEITNRNFFAIIFTTQDLEYLLKNFSLFGKDKEKYEEKLKILKKNKIKNLFIFIKPENEFNFFAIVNIEINEIFKLFTPSMIYKRQQQKIKFENFTEEYFYYLFRSLNFFNESIRGKDIVMIFYNFFIHNLNIKFLKPIEKFNFNFKDNSKNLKSFYSFNVFTKSSIFKILKSNEIFTNEKLKILKNNFNDPDICGSYRFEIEKKEIENKINSFLNKQKKEDLINLKITNLGFHFYLKNNFNSKKELSINFVSSGNATYSNLKHFIKEKENLYKNNKDQIFLFLIDEPDRSLHVNLVLKLKDEFKNLIKENKNVYLLITTHNPYFIDDDNLKDIHYIENLNNNSQIYSEIFTHNKRRDENDGLLPILSKIGIDKEFTHNLKNKYLIFVEGYSEFMILKTIKKILLDKFNDEEKLILNNIFFVFTKGICSSQIKIDILINFNDKKPLFIFDDGEAVEKYFKKEKKIICKENTILIEKKENQENADIYNLFVNEDFQNKKINLINKELIKKVSFVFNYIKAIESNQIKLNDQTISNFKKLFDEIIYKIKNF